ncbi:Holliday junction resolvase RuvX [bacterium]|nr:MAG: Holliday junction resolvase RuvX [bacterium]
MYDKLKNISELSKSGKLLAIDYGDKHVGLAISDETRTIAVPYKTLENNEALFDALVKICEDEKIQKIIVGIPIGFQGETEQTAKTRLFFQELSKHVDKLNIKMEEYNEVFTSKIARDRGKIKGDLHQNSAVILLEDVLRR